MAASSVVAHCVTKTPAPCAPQAASGQILLQMGRQVVTERILTH